MKAYLKARFNVYLEDESKEHLHRASNVRKYPNTYAVVDQSPYTVRLKHLIFLNLHSMFLFLGKNYQPAITKWIPSLPHKQGKVFKYFHFKLPIHTSYKITKLASILIITKCNPYLLLWDINSIVRALKTQRHISDHPRQMK